MTCLKISVIALTFLTFVGTLAAPANMSYMSLPSATSNFRPKTYTLGFLGPERPPIEIQNHQRRFDHQYATGSAKKGVSYREGNTNYANKFTNARWAYNWFMKPEWWTVNAEPLRNDIDYVPMLHHDDWEHHGQFWDAGAKSAIARGNASLLFFNEPDVHTNPDAPWVDPKNAADLYRKYMHPYRGQARLGGPAISNSGDQRRGAEGLVWLEQFLDACKDCQIDFMPVHAYALASDIKPFIDFFKNASRLVNTAFDRVAPNITLWVTEVSWSIESNPSDDEKQNLIRDLVKYFHSEPAIERYAWWSADPGNLIHPSGTELSVIGRFYNDS